ncbi:MAG: hypothetical protein AAF997_18805, partial [Myxococcota bacterium]
MGREDGDITALRHELTQELRPDDLVEDREGVPPTPPPTLVESPAAEPPALSNADRMRRARQWVEECERELRDQPDARRAGRRTGQMARTCAHPPNDAPRAPHNNHAS